MAQNCMYNIICVIIEKYCAIFTPNPSHQPFNITTSCLSQTLISCVKRKYHIVCDIWNRGRDLSFPTCIRKEIETRKLERKSKQQISRLNDLFCRLNDIICRLTDTKLNVNLKRENQNGSNIMKNKKLKQLNNKYVV